MAVQVPLEAPTLRYLSSFGQQDGLGKPCGMAIGPSNVIYVADAGYGRVVRFSENGTFLDSFCQSERGWLNRIFGGTIGGGRTPSGIAIDGEGCSWIAYAIGDSISKFDPAGRLMVTFGHKGKGEGEFDRPRSVELDRDGCPWVVDAYNHRVQKFDPAGRFLMAFGHKGNDPAGEGAFDNPSDLAFDERGFVHVTDSYNDRVQVFDPEGRFVGQFGSSGQGDGQFRFPRGIAIDGGLTFVIEFRNHRVQAFDRDGHFLASLGSEGSGDGQFNQPYGVAVLGRELLVTDNQNQRIVRLGLE
jgi:DNA-binding beta-propeller fold protein YncE